MTTRALYLRPDAFAEPLFHQWFAFAPLIPPPVAALFVAQSHLKILESFCQTPKLHAQALKNPALAGGPFVNIDPSRVEEVKDLLGETRKRCAPLLELAEAIKAVDDLLLAEAKGLSLAPLYARVPAALKGYVELTYDRYHAPSVRFLEGLLYRSRFNQQELQSCRLALNERNRRPNALSTPRLRGSNPVQVDRPFKDPAYDSLFRARRTPTDPGELADALGIEPAQRDRFFELFTDTPPPAAPRFQEDGVRVRYFGHACALIESRHTTILTDPLVSPRSPEPPDRFTYDDLPERIDYVLITHGHADHLVFESLLELRHRIGAVVVPRANGNGLLDPSMRELLKSLGFPRVLELEELDELPVEGGSITGVPFLGEHCDLEIRGKLSYFIRLEGKSFLAATDSNALEPETFRIVADCLGPLDVLLLGTESEGAPISYAAGSLFTRPVPRDMDRSRRQNGSNCAGASRMVELLKPAQVENYAMGLEPWLKHVFPVEYTETSPQILESNRFLEWCRSQGIPAERPFCKREFTLV